MSDETNSYWRNNHNTPLTPENETRFKNWIERGKQKYGRDLSPDMEDYDLKGYWINGGHTNEAFRAGTGHAPDTYKKPNHPTFSDESIYHGKPSPYGGTWQGGKWSNDGTNDFYTPSKHMLTYTHPVSRMTNYMARFEPKVKLVLP